MARVRIVTAAVLGALGLAAIVTGLPADLWTLVVAGPVALAAGIVLLARSRRPAEDDPYGVWTRPASRRTRWLRFGMATVLVLAALVVTVRLDHPWRRDWWPGDVHYGALPDDPCGALSDQRLFRLRVQKPARRPAVAQPGAESAGCRWTSPTGWTLDVTYARFKGDAGTRKARDAARLLTGNTSAERAGGDGTGDEAWYWTTHPEPSRFFAAALARRANMIVTVVYATDRAGEDDRADVLAAVRDAMAPLT